MYKPYAWAILALASLVPVQSPLAADDQPDPRTRLLAATCGNCHGTHGQSLGATPSLAGQDKAYLLEVMKEFKANTRESTVMRKYVLGYTDEEIAKLAEHFSRLK